jgi:hypothetical protein
MISIVKPKNLEVIVDPQKSWYIVFKLIYSQKRLKREVENSPTMKIPGTELIGEEGKDLFSAPLIGLAIRKNLIPLSTTSSPPPLSLFYPSSLLISLKMPPIPITILTGFLGSGKTTLLLNLLPQLRSQNPTYKLALLKNEFGDLAIDSQLASASSIGGVRELLNGCICCNLVGQLDEALKELAVRPLLIREDG